MGLGPGARDPAPLRLPARGARRRRAAARRHRARLRPHRDAAGRTPTSLRDVIAFPKTTAARALFEGAPTTVPRRTSDAALAPAEGDDRRRRGRERRRRTAALHRGRRPAAAGRRERRQPARAAAHPRRARGAARRRRSPSAGRPRRWSAPPPWRSGWSTRRGRARRSTPDDVLRLSRRGGRGDAGAGAGRRLRSCCRACARSSQPKTAGQAQYLQAHLRARHRRRHRPGRHGQDVPRRGRRRRHARAQAGAAHRPRAAGGRGRRVARLPARRPAGEGRPVPAAAVRRARGHDAAERMQRALETRTIEIAPLAYMRGRTLGDAFVILDEAQNATSAQMKMFLTRLGRELARRHHRRQDADRPAEPRGHRASCRWSASCPASRASLSTTSTDADVVRHRLVREIIRAYAEDQNG